MTRPGFFVYNKHMAATPPVVSPTIRAHRRQLVWQILIPFAVMAGLVVTGAVLVVWGEAPQTRVWADISIMWLIAPLLALALVLVTALVFAIVGLAKLLQMAPRYTVRAQSISLIAAAGARKAADGIVAPYVWFEQAKAALKSIFGL
jgi:hypothetical protein